MDIENMQPFCQPFGGGSPLDAASPLVTADVSRACKHVDAQQANNNNNNDSAASDNNNKAASEQIKNNFAPTTLTTTTSICESRTSISSPTGDSILSKPPSDAAATTTTTKTSPNAVDIIVDSIVVSSSPEFYKEPPFEDDDEFFSSLDLCQDIGVDFNSPTDDIDGLGGRISSSSASNKQQHLYDDGAMNIDDLDNDVDFDDDELKQSSHQDTWLCNQYSLLSPYSSNKRRSLVKQALLTGTLHNHNQLFPLDLDSIDNKSSPTLAQLNLNPTDDPSDTFWDPSAPTSCGQRNSHLSSSHNHVSSSNRASLSANQDLSLPSNCTSILSNSTRSIMHDNIMNNIHHHNDLQTQHNHLQNQQQISITNNHRGQQNTQATASSYLGQQQQQAGFKSNDNNSTIHGLHYSNHDNQLQQQQQQHQHHHHHHHHHLNDSTCLSVAPFRKAPETACQTTYYQSTNNNLLTTATKLNPVVGQDGSQTESNQQQAVSSSYMHHPPGHHNQQSHNNQPQQQTQQPAQQIVQQLGHHQLSGQQFQVRAASPAIVTSSSSLLSVPQSTTASEINNALPNIDNKLKENIDYLTALICNGNNKLDHQQQQHHDHQKLMQVAPNGTINSTSISSSGANKNNNSNNNNPANVISSTISRSYSTLAHSLSTGPKLFERQQATACYPASGQFQNHQTVCFSQSFGKTQTGGPVTQYTNEASPCKNELVNNSNNGHPAAKRPFTDQWHASAQITSSSPSVETRISAADSTESQVSSFNCSNVSTINYHEQQQCQLGLHNTSSLHQQQQQHRPQACQYQQRQAPSMSNEVLSSLLTNKQSTANCLDSRQSNYIQGVGMQIQQPSPQEKPMATNAQAPTAFKSQTDCPKGKPITLTPINNLNNPIMQQRQQQMQQLQQQTRARNPTFTQPGSPSSSSTASSGANTDIGSSSGSSLATCKRQRADQAKCGAKHKGPANMNRLVRPNSMSTDCSLSSHDEGFSSQVDNDDNDCVDSDDEDDDVDSDDESFYGDYTNSDLIGASISDNAEDKWTLNMGRTRRNGQKRYFWQYNVQSKGPKGTRMTSTDDSGDPFVLPEASDPVFSSDCQVEGVKHSGKARRGDGNDLTPNPKKLLMIGLELKKLSKIINDLAPVVDMPINARNKTRKEKNKLASRACRLKKKAQHEANKIKLYGLQREHQQVVLAIYDIRKMMSDDPRASIHQEPADSNCNRRHVESQVESMANKCTMTVAGQTSDYVNSVLEKVVSGCIDGGLTVQ